MTPPHIFLKKTKNRRACFHTGVLPDLIVAKSSPRGSMYNRIRSRLICREPTLINLLQPLSNILSNWCTMFFNDLICAFATRPSSTCWSFCRHSVLPFSVWIAWNGIAVSCCWGVAWYIDMLHSHTENELLFSEATIK